jgi:hypothetical protein
MGVWFLHGGSIEPFDWTTMTGVLKAALMGVVNSPLLTELKLAYFANVPPNLLKNSHITGINFRDLQLAHGPGLHSTTMPESPMDEKSGILLERVITDNSFCLLSLLNLGSALIP